MYVVCVTIRVKSGHEDDFRRATLENARGTRGEPGNIRFDVLQGEDEPGRWFLYEAYRTKDDFAAHQRTPHYLAWKAAVADWMAASREGVKHRSVFPEDPGW